ncbi:MAG: SURF1 family protein [Pseudomonadota bacterium]
MQFRFLNVEFKPTWLGTLITLVCIPTFIKLGYWQYDKAVLKQKIQANFEQTSAKQNPNLKDYLGNSEQLEFKKVEVEGKYDTAYQILIDNKVENSLAGYHVITPLKIHNSDTYVLVNRGWIQGNKKRADIPVFDTPTGELTVKGMAWLPTKKIFTLEDSSQPEQVKHAPTKAEWQLVWQNLDMQKYVNTAPIKILPVIVKLDNDSPAGGFVRNWQMSADRIVTHMGYAYQWFGFAFAALMIYLYLSMKKIN